MGQAGIQSNFGAALRNRLQGTRAENLEWAIEAFKAVLTVYTQEGFPVGRAGIQSNFGAALRNRLQVARAENLRRAVEAFKAILTAHTQEEFPVDRAGTQSNLGAALRNRIEGARAENLQRAIEAVKAVLIVYTQEGFPVDWAGIQSNLGAALRNRIEGARAENLQRAVEAFKAAITVHTQQARPRVDLRALRSGEGTLARSRDWRIALNVFEQARASFRIPVGQALDTDETLDFIREAGSLFFGAAYAAAQLGKTRRAFALLDEGKAKRLGMALKHDALPYTPEERDRRDRLRREICAAEIAYESAQDADKAALLARLRTARNALLHLVETVETRADVRNADDVSSRIATLLPKGGALSAILTTEHGSILFLGTMEGDAASLRTIDVPQLSESRVIELLLGHDANGQGWLGAYFKQRDSHQDWGRWQDEITRIGTALWPLFGAPLATALDRAGVKPGAPLIIMPQSRLGLLPLHLAQDPDTGRRLIDDHDISYVPSLAAWASGDKRVQASATEPTLAAVLNPTLDLTFTLPEGDLTASWFTPEERRTVLREGAATREATLAALQNRDYWHFSCHGVFDWKDAHQSGLVLAGKQVLNVSTLMDATGLQAPRLVVLSACETGLYDIGRSPDEFVGLPAALLQLGAAGVLSTLWPVADLSTTLLIARFYDLHLGEEKLPPAAALRQAQLWLRTANHERLDAWRRQVIDEGRIANDDFPDLRQALRASAEKRRGFADHDPDANDSDLPYEHPFYWAGFILTGC